MAEYSLQFWELNLDKNIKPDFDILKVAETLQPNESIAQIDEGFGFVGIGKDENGQIFLAMPAGQNEDGEDLIVWTPYEEIINDPKYRIA